MQPSGQPGQDLKFVLLRFVTEVILAEHRTGPATQKGQDMKTFFGNSPAVYFRLSLVPTVHQKRDNAHHGYQNWIAKDRIRGQKIDDRLPGNPAEFTYWQSCQITKVKIQMHFTNRLSIFASRSLWIGLRDFLAADPT